MGVWVCGCVGGKVPEKSRFQQELWRAMERSKARVLGTSTSPCFSSLSKEVRMKSVTYVEWVGGWVGGGKGGGSNALLL